MGRRTDDPRIFKTVVDLIDCSVVLRTTKVKARNSVSDPPPNSIDSDVKGDETGDVHLSQSTTDTSVQIELPEGGAESATQGRNGVTNVDAQADAGNTTDGPETPGYIATPVQTNFEKEKKLTARTDGGLAGTANGSHAEVRTSVMPRGVVLSEFNRMMKKIDTSELVQEELKTFHPCVCVIFP